MLAVRAWVWGFGFGVRRIEWNHVKHEMCVGGTGFWDCHVGAHVIRTGFGVYHTIARSAIA